jgi:hypothetical protein
VDGARAARRYRGRSNSEHRRHNRSHSEKQRPPKEGREKESDVRRIEKLREVQSKLERRTAERKERGGSGRGGGKGEVEGVG